MINDDNFGRLAPRALAWAKSQEDLILKYGSPLSLTQAQDAERAGVQDVARVRVLVVDRIAMPEDEDLADAARRSHIITEASSGSPWATGSRSAPALGKIAPCSFIASPTSRNANAVAASTPSSRSISPIATPPPTSALVRWRNKRVGSLAIFATTKWPTLPLED